MKDLDSVAKITNKI